MPAGAEMSRVSAVQMNSSSFVRANLDRADSLIGQAVEAGAGLVVLPENFALMPAREEDRLEVAERPGIGPIQEFLSGQAADRGIWLVGGTIPMFVNRGKKLSATSLMFDPRGRQIARYDKIHLFDVSVSESEAYKESDFFEGGGIDGENFVCIGTPFGTVGLTICYDIRFPELYRRLSALGVTVFTVPSAFTATTGQAHWQVLLRARAIENQAYVIAPGQCGTHDNGRETHGHSMIIDPWGRVTGELTDEPEGVVIAEIERDKLESIRRHFPSLKHRRL
jgi:nitrilase